MRKLLKTEGITVHHWTPEIDLSELLDRLAGLEQSTWKGDRQVGLFVPRSAAFNRDLITYYSSRGEVDLRWIELNGRVVSYRIGFIWSGTYYDYNTAFHPDVGSLSPSNTLLHLTLEDVARRGVERVDFCRGVQRYKLEWALGLRNNVLLRAYNTSAYGRLLRLLSRAKATLCGSRADRLPPLPIPLKRLEAPQEGTQ